MGRISDFWGNLVKDTIKAQNINFASQLAYRNELKQKADNKLGKLQHSSIEHKIGVKHSNTKGIALGTKTKE